MMITIDRLETLLIDESKHPMHAGGKVDPFRHCYPILYLAAKFGKITLLDMLIASHENDFLDIVLLRDITRRSEERVVRQVVQHIEDRESMTKQFYPAKNCLLRWLLRK